MKRVMSVWFPRFPVDVLRRTQARSGERSDNAPLLVAATIGQRRVVAACCERAARAGVRSGMPLSAARAILPGTRHRLEEHRPDRDRRALLAVAAWSQRFSPLVAADEPDGLLLDVGGCERLFGGEESLARRVQRDLARLGLTARLAVAPTLTCAWGLARYGPQTLTLVPPGGERAAMKNLPIAALRPEEETASGLHEVGVERIGELLDIPRAALPARFGTHLLARLDAALGAAPESFDPLRPAQPLRVERTFDGPVRQLEAIQEATRGLVIDLCARLRACESGAGRIDLECARADLSPIRLCAHFSRPSRDARHAWSLLRPRLDRLDMGFGVERIALSAGRVARARHGQRTMWDDANPDRASPQALDGLLDTLANRMGPDRVLGAGVRDSHLPERGFGLTSILAQRAENPRPQPALHADRPTVLLEAPESAQVMALTPDGPVHRVRWRGYERAITTCLGPERISPEWWRKDEPTRDYFKVQDDMGQWLWLVREVETARWFVHGVWA